MVGIGTTVNIESDVGDIGNSNGSDTFKHKLLWHTAEVSVVKYADSEEEDNGIDNE